MKKTIFFGSLICALFIASPAFAQSANASLIAQLNAQIKALQAQIAALEAAGASGTPSSTTNQGHQISCAKITANLQKGARGQEVKELQAFLANFYKLDASATVTGYFGPITHANVVKFQKEVGLPSFGFVGGLTRAAIAKKCAEAAAQTPTQPTTPAQPVAPAQPATPIENTATSTTSNLPATSVVIASPYANLTYYQAEAITVMWQVKNAPPGAYTKLTLVPTSGASTTLIADRQSAESGMRKFDWAIPLSATVGTYKVRVSVHVVSGEELIAVESGTFTVVATNITTSITSPGAGSVYVRGQNVTITWVITGAPSGASVALSLVRSTGENVAEIIQNTYLDGSQGYTLPVNMAAGEHYIKVTLNSSASTEITSFTSSTFTVNP